MNEEMKAAWLEISQMLGEPTKEELDVFLRTWQRATEAHKKALAEQPAQQEPLEYWNAVEGWVKIDEVREHFDSVGCGTIYKTPGDGRVPLTTAQRTWVGLTDEDLETEFGFIDELLRDCCYRTETKLKEKNT